jgi:negative regulator of flagellin synthesis FlgM
MKIDESLLKTSALPPATSLGNAEKSNVASKTDNDTTEKVTISKQARDLKSLQTQTSSEGAFDAQKVAAIKEAIMNGTFKVDASKVADGLINSTRDFLVR